LQKQIYKLQDQINNEKSKNSNLLNQIKMVKNLKEIDAKSSAKNLNDEIRRLTNLNKNLTYLYIIFNKPIIVTVIN